MRASDDESPATAFVRTEHKSELCTTFSRLTVLSLPGWNKNAMITQSDMINDPYKGYNKATTLSKWYEGCYSKKANSLSDAFFSS